LLSDFDNHDPDFDVMALVPEHLRENWDETVKHIMEEWDKWSSTEPPPDLLEYGGVSVILDAPVRESAPVVDRLLVDVPEACRILSCGRTLIYDLIRTRELCSVKLGRPDTDSHGRTSSSRGAQDGGEQGLGRQAGVVGEG
jgi:hypothetical protein